MPRFCFLFSDELKNQGVQDLFVLCTRGELHIYRVPTLLEVYEQQGLTVHHTPFPDGDVPDLEQCCQILMELQRCLESNRRTVIQWVKSAPTWVSLRRKCSIGMCRRWDKTFESCFSRWVPILGEKIQKLELVKSDWQLSCFIGKKNKT